MPEFTTSDGIRLHYIDRGEGEETVVLSHSYLVDHSHFAPQIETLSRYYRVLAYDHRGHGASDKPHGGYSMERIFADGVAFLEAMKCGPIHWIGLSTGGFVGMRIAFRRPELLKSLVLMDTSASPETIFNHLKYRALFIVLKLVGIRPVLGEAMKGLFGHTFLEDPARLSERQLWRQRITENDFDAIIAFGKGIFGRADVTEKVQAIALPTLVIVGEEDLSTPPQTASKLAHAIPGARLEIVARAGHLCTVEEPEAVNQLLLDFVAAESRPSA